MEVGAVEIMTEIAGSVRALARRAAGSHHVGVEALNGAQAAVDEALRVLDRLHGRVRQLCRKASGLEV